MSDVSLELMAKYPFLDYSRDYLSDTNPIEVIRKDKEEDETSQVLQTAIRRIHIGINSGMVPLFREEEEEDNEEDEESKEAKKADVFDPDDKTIILSYPIARILVSIFDEVFVIKQYARAEAKAAVKHLEKDINSDSQTDLQEFGFEDNTTLSLEEIKEEYNLDFEEFTGVRQLVNESKFVEELETNSKKKNKEILESIGAENTVKNSEQLGSFTKENSFMKLSTYFFNQLEVDRKYARYYRISLEDYLRLTKDKNEAQWNLPNRILFDGRVIIMESELFSLIEEAFFNDIYETLPLDVPDNIANLLEDDVDDIDSFIPDELVFEEINIVEEGVFPPVIKTILERVRKGEPVIHEERITLATFLIHIGMSDDEIINLLDVHPDFDENTRYQLQHLRTKGEGGEPYTPPTYSTLRAWGIEWEEDELEQKVSHPLGYYRIKLSSMGKLDEDGEAEAIDDELSEDME